MTFEQIMKVTEFIDVLIARNSPIIKLGYDKSPNIVIEDFLMQYDLEERVDEEYKNKLISKCRFMKGNHFEKNPYLSTIHVPEKKIGKFLITNVSYDRGELFVYDMPALYEDIVVPKLGYFDERVSFPAVYEDNVPWVSVCPSEINSMGRDVDRAYGNCLILGLGLGYYTYMISLKKEVKSIVVVERQPEIIKLFIENILPQFLYKEKIKVVQADAFDYLNNVFTGEFDFCYADIWENQIDGAECYKKIKPHELRLPSTDFAYWIEGYIR